MKNIVEFLGYPCYVYKEKYTSNNRTAIQLVTVETGEPMLTATSNLPNFPLKENEILIKNYSENKGIYEVLVKAKIISEFKALVETGFVDLYLCECLI